jgi:hypothetical protein
VSLTFNLGFILAKSQPLSFDLCHDFVAHFDRLYQADPKKKPNPMRKNAATTLWNRATKDIFNYVQFPTRYWYPQDHRGIVDRTTFMHGVVVQREAEYTNDGRYFNYSPDALKAYFGVDMSLKTNDFIDAKQCRNGVEIYVGKIQVFHPTYRSDRKAGYIGRRDPYDKSNIDNWKDGDILVKISDDCKTPSTPLPWPSTSVDRIFTLVNPTSGKALGLAGTDCQGAR